MPAEAKPEPRDGPNDALPPSRLDLWSISKLEALLGISREVMRELASTSGSLYRPFEKRATPKPFQKKPRLQKVRYIDNPLVRLKKVQGRIYRRLLRPIVLPNYLCGGVGGKTVLDAVLLHQGSKVLVRVDIKSFFPSVSNIQVYNVWSRLLNCSPQISSLLTKMTTFERHLPQGAPTSTLLANLVLYNIDAPIRRVCIASGIRYSSWVDDLAFSGDGARQVVETAVSALQEGGFSVAHKKLKIMGPGGRKVLCGVLMGRFPNVVRDRISSLRSGIHKLRTGEVQAQLRDKYITSLEGSIRQMSTINRRKGMELAKQLKKAIEADPFS